MKVFVSSIWLGHPVDGASVACQAAHAGISEPRDGSS